MKKLLVLLCLASGFSQSVSAADITLLNNLSATEFKTLSEDFGSAFSYKPVSPTAPLGGLTGFGFDIGVEATSTDISKSAAALDKATGTSTGLSTLIIPKLHVAVGLPFGIDVAAFTSAIPSSNIKLTGAELRVAIIKGGVAAPAISIRGAMTQVSGVDQLAFSTKSVDLSISKGFAMLTPYAGIGQVWVTSTANVTGAGGATLDESFTQSKIFAGANLNLGLTNFDLEYDTTGGTSSYSLKMGFRW
jgi:hypothetical protein